MSQIAVQPRIQELNSRLEELDKIKRQMTYEKLSSSPDTADFATPEVQQALIEEYKAHPEWLSNESERTAHLMDAYYIARGKLRDKVEKHALQTGQNIGAQNEAAKQHARVESSSVADNTVKKFDPMTADLKDLDAALMNALKKEGKG
jgi:hypothetical protein